MKTSVRKIFFYFGALVICTIVLLAVSSDLQATRLEMVSKLALLSFLQVALSLQYLRRAKVIFLWGVLVYLFASIDDSLLLSKQLPKILVCVALLASISGILGRNWIFIIIFALAAFVAYDLANRSFLALVAVFLVLSLIPKGKRVFYLTALQPFYVLALAFIGYLFIFEVPIIAVTASNVQRSSMIYAAVVSLPWQPLGHSGVGEYIGFILYHGVGLYSDEFIDPHNYFVKSLVWGGVPLLTIYALSTFLTFKNLLQGSQSTQFSCRLAVAAFSVQIALSTLSFQNVLIALFFISVASIAGSPKVHSSKFEVIGPERA